MQPWDRRVRFRSRARAMRDSSSLVGSPPHPRCGLLVARLGEFLRRQILTTSPKIPQTVNAASGWPPDCVGLEPKAPLLGLAMLQDAGDHASPKGSIHCSSIGFER